MKCPTSIFSSLKVVFYYYFSEDEESRKSPIFNNKIYNSNITAVNQSKPKKKE